MRATRDDILAVFDRCATEFTFPALDNGYLYLAATRLSLFRSDVDWALVIEVFGFSPRAEAPDTAIHTFANRLQNRQQREDYANEDAYRRYLARNPHNEARFVFPLELERVDDEALELVAEDAREVSVRGRSVVLPSRAQYAEHGIVLEDPERIQVFELCRYLAAVAREDVLALASERRANVPPELSQIMQLEEWHHPDLSAGAKPSDSLTFQQLARVLETGDTSLYRPAEAPNTHWRHWPEGGTL